MQKCQKVTAPTLQQGVKGLSQQCHAIHAPTLFRCHLKAAEMPSLGRANNQRPLQKRRNVRYASPRTKQGDPLWINVTKTQPLPRYI